MAENGAVEAKPQAKPQQVFLQMLLSRGIVSEREAIEAMEKIFDRLQVEAPEDGLSGFITGMNAQLNEIYMEIRSGVSEEDGTLHYALINTYEDAVAKIASGYEPKKLAYFNKVLEMIVGEEGIASSVDLINSKSMERPLTVTEAEKTLESFTKDHWLHYNREEGEYSLGTRALIALKPFLVSTFPGIVADCYMCHDMVLKGDYHDDKKMHHHCMKRFLATRRK
eukprot:m.179110 g.179110  ORF g.179110 m.179110 type:complete len:224 (+) comp39207_c0_seq15:29-700(+)